MPPPPPPACRRGREARPTTGISCHSSSSMAGVGVVEPSVGMWFGGLGGLDSPDAHGRADGRRVWRERRTEQGSLTRRRYSKKPEQGPLFWMKNAAHVLWLAAVRSSIHHPCHRRLRGKMGLLDDMERWVGSSNAVPVTSTSTRSYHATQVAGEGRKAPPPASIPAKSPTVKVASPTYSSLLAEFLDSHGDSKDTMPDMSSYSTESLQVSMFEPLITYMLFF